MWEISISVTYKFKKSLDNLKQDLAKIFGNEIVIASAKIESEYVLSLAFKDDIRLNEYKNILKKHIAETIIKMEKEEYLKNKLNFTELQPSFKNALVKALTLFDINQDIKFVMTRLDLDKNINLNAFYQFRLRILRHKWEEIVCLTNQENFYLKKPEVLLEFLKFLVENIPETNLIISLKKKGNEYLICNSKTHRVIKQKTKIDITSELDIIPYLITLSPKKIYINCSDYLSEEVILFLKYLFNQKIIFN